jgi:hypothetical protein
MPSPARISSLGVPTRDRPDRLRACLLGHARCGRLHGWDVDFVVVDISTRPAARAANRALLCSLRAEFGPRFRYAGDE